MGNYKEQKKKVQKRNKGKKFVYRNPTELAAKQVKVNPFEDMSKKKFQKQGKQYQGVINEYQNRFNSSTFIDKRIGEGSKGLSTEDKMKMRFKAQQMINLKSRKNKFSLLNEENGLDKEEHILTHRGKVVDDDNMSDVEKSDDDEIYGKMDNYMEEMDQNRGKMSRKEIIQNIINKSKLLKEEKQRIKQENRDKIALLDDNFTELSSLLKKRGRTFGKLNDDYDKFANNFVHAEKTHPTDRVKSVLEVEMEKEMKTERLQKKRLKEEIMKDDEDEQDEINADDEAEKKKLTKKERIEKLIADRLSRSGKIVKEDIITKRNKGEGEDASDGEQDNLSDLEEFDQKDEGDDGEDGEDEDNEDNEDDENGSEGEEDFEGEEDNGEENEFDYLDDLNDFDVEEEEEKPKNNNKKRKNK